MISLVNHGLILIGAFHLLFGILGAVNLCHYRLYISMEDKVIISKAEYEALKKMKDKP